MAELFDTHCHVDFDRYDKDRDAVIARATEAGVTRILNPGTDIHTSQSAIQLAERFPGMYAAVGLHPNSTASWSPEAITTIAHLAKHEKVVAIGEIGLDYYWDKSPKAIQHAAFKAQLDLARQLQLPVIIHNRDASDDVLKVLQEWVPTLPAALRDRPGVMHSFSAAQYIADAVLELGFYLGFTGPVTFRKANDLRAVASRVPTDRLLIETDGPFLTPHPYRGKRNEPAYVQHVAERLSALHQVSTETMAQITTENALRLFGVPS